MDILKMFSTDLTAEVAGIWSPLAIGVEVLVARNGTRAYSRDITREVEKYSLALEGKNEESDLVSEAIMVDVMSRHILLDWKGFSDAEGNEVPYSKAEAKKYLACKDFRKKITSIADDMSRFKAKQEVATAANL